MTPQIGEPAPYVCYACANGRHSDCQEEACECSHRAQSSRPAAPESLVERAVQRLRDNIARREADGDVEALKAVLVEMDRLATALSLAQTEIKEHMRVEDELKAQLLLADRAIAGTVHIIEKAQTRIAELEKDAARWKGLKELAGYLQDGSQTTILLDQDDATRTAFIRVGQKYYSVDGCGFDSAIDAALKDRA